MATTVHVKNISAQTQEKEVRDFFSFCGKINSLNVSSGSDGTQTATVSFEKPTAAKTALLLDNTQLGPNLVVVTSNAAGEESGDKSAGASADSTTFDHDVDQEDKPRSRILAEYLAHGYVISDKAIENAIALDNQHGISARFTSALQQFDSKYQASARAQELDAKYKVSETAASGWRTMASYFEKALDTQSGQRVRSFYEQGNKQVLDVHAEARRLADLKSPTKAQPVAGTNKTTCNCSADSGKCACEPGKCACSSCGKNKDESSGAEKAGSEKVAST